MNKTKKSQLMRRYLAGIAAILSLTAIGSIWAYYHTEGALDNNLKTKKYGGEQIVEKFTPNEDWELGERITKEVLVENTGNVELLVRIKLDEKWTRDNDDFITLNSTDGIDQYTNVHFIAGSGQLDAADGSTLNDGSVVTKVLGSNRWIYSTDGYWYYNSTLKPTGMPGDRTELFLESIILAKNTDMGLLEELKYYTTMDSPPANNSISDDPATGWKLFTGPVPNGAKYSRSISDIKPEYAGYSNANYSLTITYETYQATMEARAEAVSEAGGNWDNTKTPIINE